MLIFVSQYSVWGLSIHTIFFLSFFLSFFGNTGLVPEQEIKRTTNEAAQCFEYQEASFLPQSSKDADVDGPARAW